MTKQPYGCFVTLSEIEVWLRKRMSIFPNECKAAVNELRREVLEFLEDAG